GARQQHVDLDEIAKAGAGLIEHALHVPDDVIELRLEAVRQRAVFVEAGHTGDEQEVAGPCRKRERRRLDAGRGREMLDGHVSPLMLVSPHRRSKGRGNSRVARAGYDFWVMAVLASAQSSPAYVAKIVAHPRALALPLANSSSNARTFGEQAPL